MPVSPLPAEALFSRCPEEHFSFATTEDLESLNGLFGQERALEAIRFGTQIHHPGYNLFVLGPDEAGKVDAVHRYLIEAAKSEPTPSDWVYVTNFTNSNAPTALRLTPGEGHQLKRKVGSLIHKLKSGLPAVFESDEYLNRRQTIESAFEGKHTDALNTLKQNAEEKGIALVKTDRGIGVAPLKDGEILQPDDFAALDPQEQQRIEALIEELQGAVEQIFREVPKWEAERAESLEELNREVARSVVDGFMEPLTLTFKENEDVLAWLEDLAKDIVDEVNLFAPAADSQGGEVDLIRPAAPAGTWQEPFQRYDVNLIIDHSKTQGAPVVVLDFPTYGNLAGRLEHRTHLGSMVTDFSLIRPGALHMANGGYLLIDARKILREPLAWDALKRALRRESLRIESLSDHYSLVSTVSVEPQPIPLDVKVVLFGPATLYHLLCAREPDFPSFFKVQVEFNDRIEREDTSTLRFARLIGTLARENGLKPLDPGGVARVVEQSSRTARDGERLSILLEPLSDLIREADYFARRDGYPHITGHHVELAVEAARSRADRSSERSIEFINREIINISTEGEVVGQINALVVHSLPNFSWGRPSRVTVRVRPGSGGISDIERVVGFGRSIYSKGVEILNAYFLATFTKDRPLSFAATIAHEQSYGPIDGDSASSTELYVLMSALAEAPVRQGIAVTGSVNQFGDVQTIGGVNEKIEGFFDVCVARGLTGDQGVLIPKINQKDLMLRRDVVEAAREGKFHIYPIERIEEGIEILTGIPAGTPDEDGNYPDVSIYGRVAQRLKDFVPSRNGNGADANGKDAASKPPEEPKSRWWFW